MGGIFPASYDEASYDDNSGSFGSSDDSTDI
jgi:hypothetical protein